MAPIQFIVPPGPSAHFSQEHHYSQAVDVGNGIVQVSGQGGWDPVGGKIHKSAEEQVRLTLDNLGAVLKATGCAGLDDVYFIRSFHTNIDVTLPCMSADIKKRMPDVMPASTAVSINRLEIPSMKVEIEVDAKKQGV